MNSLEIGTALDFGDIVRIGNPWHGPVRHRQIDVYHVEFSNPSGMVLRSGDPITVGSLVGYVTAFSPTAAFIYVPTAPSEGSIISGRGYSFEITAVVGTVGVFERYVVTDIGGIEQPIAWWAASANITGIPWIAVKYTKPGQPEVSTPSEEQALGMEWRNFVLAPGAFGDGHTMYPFTDDAGTTWIITQFSAQLLQDGSGAMAISILPVSAVNVLGPTPAATVVQRNYASGTFSGQIDTGGRELTGKMLDSKDHGRNWMFGIVAGLDDYDATLYGIYEVRISGVGTVVDGRLTGISAELVILRDTVQCGWYYADDGVDPADVSSSLHTIYPEESDIEDAFQSWYENGGEVSYHGGHEDYFCKIRTQAHRIVGAWYDAVGAIVPVDLWEHKIICISFSTTFQWKINTISGGIIQRLFIANESGTDTRIYTIRSGEESTPPIVARAVYNYDYDGSIDNSGTLVEHDSLKVSQAFDNTYPADSCVGLLMPGEVTLSSRDRVTDFPIGTEGPGGLGNVNCVMRSDLSGATSPFLAHYIPLDYSAYPVRLFWMGVTHRSARCYGLACICTRPLNNLGQELTGDRYGGIVGWISPSGFSPGPPLDEGDGIGVLLTHPTFSAFMYNAYTSHNPHTGETVVGEEYPVFHV